MSRLDREFFDRDTLDVAKDLLGKIIVYNKNNISYEAMIVETEAYLGLNDRAAHSFGGNITNRNKVMYMDPGTIYVYQTYGIHFMLNFVTLDESKPEAVLIRALEPLNELDNISLNRFGSKFDDLKPYQKRNLTNGPGKLTKALEIDKSLNAKNLFTEEFYVKNNETRFEIEVDKRIGIDYSMEAIDYPYRFYIRGNKFVSKLKKEIR